MDRTVKQFYEAPSTLAFEVKPEGVICDSEVKSGNSIKGWSEGSTDSYSTYL